MATVLESLDPSVAPVSPDRYNCRTVDGIAAIAGMEAKWPSFSAGAEWGGPMASFGWSLAAAEALAGEQTPRLVMAIDDDGTLQAVAPLARSGRWGAGRLEILGLRRLNEPADFTFTDRKVLAALIDGILRLRRPLLLCRIPAESPTIELLRRASRGRAVVVVRPQASCPYIPLDETWSKPESHLSSRRRSDFRRAFAAPSNGAKFERRSSLPRRSYSMVCCKSRSTLRPVRGKGPRERRVACDPLRGGHLRRFAQWACKAGTLRIALLSVGGQPIAMQIATEEAGRWWLLKIGFDPAWSDCSPGTLLLCETLRHAVRQQLALYEFLGTVESWTQVWTLHERQCVSVRVYPLGLHGAAALAADGIEIAGRKVKRAWQSWRNRHRVAAPKENADVDRETEIEES